MSGEKITLRLKSDPSVVLPEAALINESPNFYEVAFSEGVCINGFLKSQWEPVPPPYVLPTGIGAVVRADHGTYVHVSAGQWVGTMTGSHYSGLVPKWADSGELTTLSEGVEL